MSFFLWLFFIWNHINQGWRRFGTYFKLDLFLLWLLDSIKNTLFYYWFLQFLWMIGELSEKMETWMTFHVVIWQKKMGSFWFKIFRIVYWTRICRYFFSVPPNGNIFVEQRILWNTPEFAEIKTGELWKSWSEVDKSWRKLSQQHDPSCSPDFGLQVNPIPSLLTQSPCDKVLRWALSNETKT